MDELIEWLQTRTDCLTISKLKDKGWVVSVVFQSLPQQITEPMLFTALTAAKKWVEQKQVSVKQCLNWISQHKMQCIMVPNGLHYNVQIVSNTGCQSDSYNVSLPDAIIEACLHMSKLTGWLIMRGNA